MQRVLVLAFLLLSIPSFAQLKLARLFTDHAVLQRQKTLPVWGWAAPNSTVKVTFGYSNPDRSSRCIGQVDGAVFTF